MAGRPECSTYPNQSIGLAWILHGLEPHHIGGDTDALNVPGCIEHLQFDGGGPRRSHAVMGHALMNRTNKIRTGVGQVETEVTVCISPGAGHFLHPLAQSDQDNVISGCRLARGGY
jgi:hypothetical protein